MERQYTRLDEARNIIDPIIKGIADEGSKRGAYVHLYGVGLLASLIALKRGHSREEAELASTMPFESIRTDSRTNPPVLPEDRRIRDLSLIPRAVREARQEEASGKAFHPAANAAFDRMTDGYSSRIQLESFVRNALLAERLAGGKAAGA